MKVKLKGSTKDNLLERICENREINFENLSDFLHPSKYCIIDPFSYDNIVKAADLYYASINKNKSIGILVDSDCDGFCSAATLVNYTKETFNFNNFIFFFHSCKAHGLTEEIMKEIEGSNIDLLVIPDAGSSDFKEHEILFKKGIEIIVIDHHLTDKYSEYALVINNQLSKKGNKSLSGCGMVLKFLECLDIISFNDNAHNFLDLVAVAIIADCMAIKNPETRYYVERGFITRNNSFLNSLIREDKPFNYEKVSFEIAPLINAFSRVATKEEKIELFKALTGSDETRSIKIKNNHITVNLVDYIKKLGSAIKKRQANIIKNALENENTKIITDNLPITICILANEEAKAVTGLLANNLVEKYKKPCIAIYQIGDIYRGSGRTIDNYKYFKDFLSGSNLFNFCEGHQEAFGLSIDVDKLFDLVEFLCNSNEIQEQDYYLVDAIYKNSVSAYDILTVGELSDCFCKGFEKPNFYVELDNPKEVDIIGSKQDTIRIKHNFITYIKFKCSKEEIDLVKNTDITNVKMIGFFNINTWNDRLFPQVIIEKLEITGIEKLNKPLFDSQFYFNW